MNHCLVFGSSGHLAKTRIIPALIKKNIDYTCVSRKAAVDFTKAKECKNVVSFMSIPTHYFIDTIEKYKYDLHDVNPLYLLEKPHGLNKENFEEIVSYCNQNNLRVLFNDHYVGKYTIRHLNELQIPNKDEIKAVKVTLHESACINDRINYFDQAGIVNDMYQSHVLMLYSIFLAEIFDENKSNILKELNKSFVSYVALNKSEKYDGKAYTSCTVKTTFRDVTLNASVSKYKDIDEKSVTIVTKSNQKYYYNLNNFNENPYEYIFDYILNEDYDKFLQKNDIKLMWDITKAMF